MEVKVYTERSLGNKKVKMNYFNYETAIVEVLGQRLVGWPKTVKFANPSEIGTVNEIRMLRDHLKSGQCHWVKLTRSQLDEHIADLRSRREAGETVGKPRKKRSDAGTSRKHKRPSENQENEAPESGPSRKRTKKSQGKHKSTAIIESSDDENQEDEEPDAWPSRKRTKKSKRKQKSTVIIESSDDGSDSGNES